MALVDTESQRHGTVADKNCWVIRVSFNFMPTQLLNEELGALLKVANAQTKMVNAFAHGCHIDSLVMFLNIHDGLKIYIQRYVRADGY
ncbi:hypothetical protein OU997_07300 [Pseudomonas sp. SL4(2022)]|nr:MULTISPECIES: hypothetical protein [unclassified Pseudomonas]WAC45956.1 hypothetical protein OU997_07300 [Pseudomonas sp. SL4(2022)]